MKRLHLARIGRREFVTRYVPACALTCLAGGQSLVFAASQEPSGDEAKHKFDLESEQARVVFSSRNSENEIEDLSQVSIAPFEIYIAELG